MKTLCLAAAVLLSAFPRVSEGSPTLICWPGWTVTSTEALYFGRKHSSFPLTYLFDNDPATAWVFSGTGKHLGFEEGGFAVEIGRGLHQSPVHVDGVWIMNGYNKSRELFLRNNRIIELKLYVDGEFLKAVPLKDSMGWHKISLPRQPVRDIELRFTKFKRGRDNDVCVSEIALYDRGKKIDLKMPKAVEFTEGDTEGEGMDSAPGGSKIIDRKGRVLLDYSDSSYCAGIGCAWSPSGRYVAAANGEVWVVDASLPKVVLKKKLDLDKRAIITELKWHGDASLEVQYGWRVPDFLRPGNTYFERHSKTFRIPDK